MAASKGNTPCGTSCPYFEQSGEVTCIGGPKQTRCRLIMKPHWVDCNEFDVRTLKMFEVEDEQFAAMQEAVGIKAKKLRKPWKKQHKETNHVGKPKKH